MVLQQKVQVFFSLYQLLDKDELTFFSQIQVNSCQLLAKEASTLFAWSFWGCQHGWGHLSYGTTLLLAVSFKCWRASLKKEDFGDTMPRGRVSSSRGKVIQISSFPHPFHPSSEIAEHRAIAGACWVSLVFFMHTFHATWVCRGSPPELSVVFHSFINHIFAKQWCSFTFCSLLFIFV